jgi:hypothetical protein
MTAGYCVASHHAALLFTKQGTTNNAKAPLSALMPPSLLHEQGTTNNAKELSSAMPPRRYCCPRVSKSGPMMPRCLVIIAQAGGQLVMSFSSLLVLDSVKRNNKAKHAASSDDGDRWINTESFSLKLWGDLHLFTFFLKVDKNLVKVEKERLSNLGFIEVKALRQTAY